MLKPPFGGVFDSELIESRPGFVSVLFKGRGARELFSNEAGGHRIQRIPPTEKRGRVHTSTITVAVLDPEGEDQFQLNESEVEITAARGSGPGGQHKNRTESCITATHRPTGLSVRIDMRSQYQSKMMALQILSSRLAQQQRKSFSNARAAERKEQLGSGQRADKRRTYRFQDDQVTDHITGKTWKLSKWLRGEW